MDTLAPGRGERTGDAITGIRFGTVFTGARGECLEDDHSGVKVQLGCGHKPWAGWINVDGDRARDTADVIADLRAVPMESDSVDVAVAIHVIEHFYQWEAGPVLQEWRRILKPGGLLILELPCMDKVLRYLAEAFRTQQPIWAQMTWWALWGDPRYQDTAMCHKWGYSEEMLRTTLAAAGFEQIAVQPPRYHVKQRDMRMVARKGVS